MDKIIHYLEDPFFMSGAVIGVKPLRGTTFFEEHWDFKTHIVDIKNTQYKVRRNDYIWAEDPQVRELQKRFLAEQSNVLEEFCKRNNVRHPNQETISMMYFKFTKQIIEDIKFEVASDGLVTTDLSIGYNGWRSYGSISKLFN